MLNASDLTAMRETAASAFPDTVSILRRTHGASGIVDGSEAATTGRLTPHKRGRTESVSGYGWAELYRLDYPYDFELGPVDKLTIGGEDYYPWEIVTARSWELTGYAIVGQLKTPHTVTVYAATESLDEDGVVLPPILSTETISAFVENGDAQRMVETFGEAAVAVTAPLMIYTGYDHWANLSAPGSKLAFDGMDYHVVSARSVPVSGVGPHVIALADREAL